MTRRPNRNDLSQASAVAHGIVIGRWLRTGVHAFCTYRPGETVGTFLPNFGIQLRWQGLQSQHLVQIGRQVATVAPLHSQAVKCHGFVTCILFFFFRISSAGHNYGPICTYYGSNDVFCFSAYLGFRVFTSRESPVHKTGSVFLKIAAAAI
jgi:hypothetical protein